MTAANRHIVKFWQGAGRHFLPFSDVASVDLPLSRLLRLSLFQISVGMAMALMVGTLNRVMIVELGISAWLVAIAIALPIAFAPFRALVGFKSDNHRSALGWRRVPYMWVGTLIQFGGLAIMPFALLILSGDTTGPLWIGHVSSALAFLLMGAGLQIVQTAGLSLATDIAPVETRPRVVALMYVMLLVGMVGSGVIFGFLLRDFSEVRLIQVVQGVALATMVLNVIALWKQEARDPSRNRSVEQAPEFADSLRSFIRRPRALRFVVALGLGTAAFTMQDIVLEPYGAEVLHLSVSETTGLTALLAGGALFAYWVAARWMMKGIDPYRLAAYGVLTGLPAFAAIVMSGPFGSPMLFRMGAAMIGFGGGLFSVATLVAAMGLEEKTSAGLALGAWGSVHATASGLAMSAGALLRDAVSSLASSGYLGSLMDTPWIGYSAVYHIELLLLFVTLAAIGPLAKHAREKKLQTHFGLAEIPR